MSIMTELVLGAVRLVLDARQVSIRCRSALASEATVYRLTVYSPCGWDGAGSTPSLDFQVTVGRGEPGNVRYTVNEPRYRSQNRTHIVTGPSGNRTGRTFH